MFEPTTQEKKNVNLIQPLIKKKKNIQRKKKNEHPPKKNMTNFGHIKCCHWVPQVSPWRQDLQDVLPVVVTKGVQLLRFRLDKKGHGHGSCIVENQRKPVNLVGLTSYVKILLI